MISHTSSQYPTSSKGICSTGAPVIRKPSYFLWRTSANVP